MEKDYDKKKGGIYFPITSSSWCVLILDGMTNDLENNSSPTFENTFDVVLQDTFLYYLFAYDDLHACVESISYVNSGSNRASESHFDSMLCSSFPFDPGDELGVITFLKVASALGGVRAWVNLVYDLAHSHEVVYVLELKRELGLFKRGINKGLRVWFPKCNGSIAQCHCQSFLNSQVTFVLTGYKPFVDHVMLGYTLNLCILSVMIE